MAHPADSIVFRLEGARGNEVHLAQLKPHFWDCHVRSCECVCVCVCVCVCAWEGGGGQDNRSLWIISVNFSLFFILLHSFLKYHFSLHFACLPVAGYVASWTHYFMPSLDVPPLRNNNERTIQLQTRMTMMKKKDQWLQCYKKAPVKPFLSISGNTFFSFFIFLFRGFSSPGICMHGLYSSSVVNGKSKHKVRYKRVYFNDRKHTHTLAIGAFFFVQRRFRVC